MTTLTVTQEKEVTVIRFVGSLDAAEVSRLEPGFQKATSAAQQGLVIDLSRVSMVATPALSMFITAVRSRRSGSSKPIFTGTKGPIDYLLHMCRLDKVLTIVPDPDEAIALAGHKTQ